MYDDGVGQVESCIFCRRNGHQEMQNNDSNRDGANTSLQHDDKDGFNFKQLWRFMGPSFLVNVTIISPAYITIFMQLGFQNQYKLLWIVILSILPAVLIFQRLSPRLGVVTGRHLAQICYTEYRFIWRLFQWLMMEIVMITSDMQAVIGATTAIYMISQTMIPPWVGVLITLVDVFILMYLDVYSQRKLELFVVIVVATIAITFGIEIYLVGLNTNALMSGILPGCKECTVYSVIDGSTLLGTFVGPHGVFLHSALAMTRSVDKSNRSKVEEANFYNLTDIFLANIVVGFIVMLDMIMLAGIRTAEDEQLHNQNTSPCLNQSIFAYSTVFEFNNKVDIESTGRYLKCKYGYWALCVWCVGVLASGLINTIIGCLSGQLIMEGFLNLKWVRWKRIVLTRAITLLLTLYLANYTKISDMMKLNNFINGLLGLQMPFSTLPLIAFSSNRNIMGPFAIGLWNKLLASGILIASTIYSFSLGAFNDIVTAAANGPVPVWGKIICVLFLAVYCATALYIMLHTAAALTSSDSLLNTSEVMKKYILGESMTRVQAQALPGSCALCSPTSS